MSLYNNQYSRVRSECCTNQYSFTRKKIIIIQERSLIISKEVFLQKIVPYVPGHVITSLETVLDGFIRSIENQLKELITDFSVEPSIFNNMNKLRLKINVLKRDVYLNTSLSRAWCQYKMRSEICSHNMCTYSYFKDIFEHIKIFMDKYGEHIIELDGCQSVPRLYDEFVIMLTNM